MRLKRLEVVLDWNLSTLCGGLFLCYLGQKRWVHFISVSRLSYTLATWLVILSVSPMVKTHMHFGHVFLFGLFMDALAMLVITIPVVFLSLSALWDTIRWFWYHCGIDGGALDWWRQWGWISLWLRQWHPILSCSICSSGWHPFVVSDLIWLVILVTFPSISLVLLT